MLAVIALLPMTIDECLICGKKLVYSGVSERARCEMCGGIFESDCRCEAGHYVCNSCHGGSSADPVVRICTESDSDNPYLIAMKLMADPRVHMHGPEHHVLVGAALLSAYRNAGGEINLDSALKEMVKRGSAIPGGLCGSCGCCGAAMSAGAFYSIATGTTPLSGKSWGDANLLTSRCLAEIGALGGPRCCKRNTTVAIREAVAYTRETLGISMSFPDNPVCGFNSKNRQCLLDRCPFYAQHGN